MASKRFFDIYGTQHWCLYYRRWALEEKGQGCVRQSKIERQNESARLRKKGSVREIFLTLEDSS